LGGGHFTTKLLPPPSIDGNTIDGTIILWSSIAIYLNTIVNRLDVADDFLPD